MLYSSHHLPVHGDDVSNERAFLHRCLASVGDSTVEGRVRAAGHQSAGPTVRDAIGHWGDV